MKNTITEKDIREDLSRIDPLKLRQIFKEINDRIEEK
jgi:hypothetical protein